MGKDFLRRYWLAPPRTVVRFILAALEDHKIGRRTFRDGDNAKCCTTRSIGACTINLIHLMLGRIDGARKTNTIAIA